MSAFVISYKELDDIADYANNLAGKASNYLTELDGVAKSVDSVTAGVNDILSDAKYYINTKKQDLLDKKNEFETFAKKVNTLREYAKTVDQEVADAIVNEKQDFLKRHTDINVSECAFIDFLIDLGEKCPALEFLADIAIDVYNDITWVYDKACELDATIKYWYYCEGGREALDLIGRYVKVGITVALLICACITGAGAIAILGAALAVINATVDYFYTSYAYEAAKKGDPTYAKIYSDVDTFSGWMRHLKSKNGLVNSGLDLLADAYDGVEAFCAIYSLASFASSLVDFAHLNTMFPSVKNVKECLINSKFSVDSAKKLNAIEEIFKTGSLEKTDLVLLLRGDGDVVKRATYIQNIIGGGKKIKSDFVNIYKLTTGELTFDSFLEKTLSTHSNGYGKFDNANKETTGFLSDLRYFRMQEYLTAE